MSRAASIVVTWAASVAGPLGAAARRSRRRTPCSVVDLGRGVRVGVLRDVGVELVVGEAVDRRRWRRCRAGRSRRCRRRRGPAPGRRCQVSPRRGVVGAGRAGAAGVDHERADPLAGVGRRDLEHRELDGLAARAAGSRAAPRGSSTARPSRHDSQVSVLGVEARQRRAAAGRSPRAPGSWWGRERGSRRRRRCRRAGSGRRSPTPVRTSATTRSSATDPLHPARTSGATRASIIDSSASAGCTLNSSICSRASKIAAIRRSWTSGVPVRASSSTSPRISSLTSGAGGARRDRDRVAVDRDQVHQAAVDDVEVAPLGAGLLVLLHVAQGRGVLAGPAAALDHAVRRVEVGLVAGVELGR